MNEEASDPIRSAIEMGYIWLLGRRPAEQEIKSWRQGMLANGLDRFDVVASIAQSPEALQRNPETRFAEYETGPFIQLVYLTTERRFPNTFEIETQRRRLSAGLTRQALVDEMTKAAFARHASTVLSDTPVLHDPSKVRIMGTTQIITAEDWQLARTDASSRGAAPCTPAGFDPAAVGRFGPLPDGVKVSVIVSLYKGGLYIEDFLDNMISQTIFRDHVELIIVDAASPDGEAASIKARQAQHPNIIYRRLPALTTIYDAWNTALEMASGAYVTNANLDDLRRSDSLEIQARTLHELPFVDVVYQDFLYTLEHDLTFDEIAQIGFTSDLAPVTKLNILRENAPHNAPMWRRDLHAELGLFDPTYTSAGDSDFWARAVLAGKCFFKSNTPHVVYFQNMTGISTRPDTSGPQESRRIAEHYGAGMVDPSAICSDEDFVALLDDHVDTADVGVVDRATLAHRALVHLSKSRWRDGRGVSE